MVKGRVGARTGIDGKGGTIVVLGDAGSMTGFMLQRGRIVICGATAHYGAEPTPIHHHLQLAMRSVTMQGFFYFAMADRWPVARARLAKWLRDGSIRDMLDIAEGFDTVPDVAIGQFAGGMKGRKLIRIAADPGADPAGYSGPSLLGR